MFINYWFHVYYRERRNGGASTFLDRTVGFKKGGFGQNKKDSKLGRGKRDKKPQKSVAQLDAELESYMSKGKDMEI
uniref:FoP_duplication domain-containing protein n=1 Tax=Heterorhabditis bacteriophora TaxID=37862 RepID=A0A1I7WUC6_HETBA